jgi:hypothetical protein
MNDNKRNLQIINDHFDNLPAHMEKLEEEEKHIRERVFEAAFPTFFGGLVVGLILADLLLK